MSQENVEIVRRAFAAWAEDQTFDPAFWAEDMQWQAASEELDPGIARGRQVAQKAVAKWFETVGPGHAALERIADVGDDVLVFGRWYPEGSLVGLPAYYIVTVVDGKIARVQVFRHRDQAFEAVGLSEQDAHADS
jgi:ketosteroid isomerase-like protein